jgi:hypothetical protein
MPVKTIITSIALCLFVQIGIRAQQAPATSSHVIEGGKLVVELIKVIGSKRDSERESGCRNNYADLCVSNQSTHSLTVVLLHRQTEETREIVVLSGGIECCLQAKVGVWTYDLRYSGSPQSLRKGDVLIEGCKDMEMTIK